MATQFNPTGCATAKIDTASSGDNTIIAAVTGKSIQVHRIKFLLNSQTTVTFKDGTTALSGAEQCNSQILDYDEEPWYKTTPGSAFTMNLGAAVQCSGTVWYRLV